MLAIVFQVEDSPGAGMFSIAGAPLIARQLQWLRACGCGRIAVEIGTDPDSDAMARWLAKHAAALEIKPVLTSRPVGAADVARRAGFAPGVPFLAVPGDVLGDGDLSQIFRYAGSGGVVARMPPPPELAGGHPGTVHLIDGLPVPQRTVVGPGWAARILSASAALELGSLALEERLPPPDGAHLWPIQVHAARVSAGVWVARGGRIEPGAHVVPPVWVGPNALVCSGATIGPAAFIGERAVVDAGAVVKTCAVNEGAIVGQGVKLSGCIVGPGSIRWLTEAQPREVHDAWLLGCRDRAFAVHPLSRVVALGVVALLVPLALATSALCMLRGQRWRWRSQLARGGGETVALHDGTTRVKLANIVPRLFDVVLGRRTLVGVAWPGGATPTVPQGLVRAAQAAPYGAFDVTRALLEGEGDPAERLRALAWYAHAKCVRLDFALVSRQLRGPKPGSSRRKLPAARLRSDPNPSPRPRSAHR